VDINSLIRNFDKNDYLKFLKQFPSQIEDALKLNIPSAARFKNDIRHVAVMGMGGSGIGGELLKSLYADSCTIPISIIRDYKVPASVDTATLAIASSYSGNTEETLAAYTEARKRGARLLCLTTGGKLGEHAANDNVPVITLPQGYQPRAAVGFSLVPLIKVLDEWNLLTNHSQETEYKETLKLLKSLEQEYNPEHVPDSAPFKLAREMHGKLPIIYTGPPPVYALGRRWCGQLEENAEVLAFCNTIPEMNHNEIMGWNQNFKITEKTIAIFLRDEFEHERVKIRMNLARDIIEKSSSGTAEVKSRGTTPLARVMSLLYFGDYTSYYLALLNGKNPTSIGNIDNLKENLSKM